MPLPTEIGLSGGAKLSWAGFTDEGTPATYDTKGIVRIGKNNLILEQNRTCLQKQVQKQLFILALATCL